MSIPKDIIRVKFLAFAALALLAACANPGAAPVTHAPAAPTPPATRIDAVGDTYHGVSVADPYRWLETAGDPAVIAWSKAQNAYAHAVLNALPERAAVEAQLRRLSSAAGLDTFSRLSFTGGQLFALRSTPSHPRPALVILPSPDAPAQARTVFDPMGFDRSGRTAIDWYVVSHDGRSVALSLSQGGSENGDLRVVDVVSGMQKPDAIPRVEGGTAGGDVAWLPDNSGFFYTRYPRKGERSVEDEGFYVQVYLHRLGDDPAKDAYVFGRESPRIAEYRLFMDAPTGRLLISMQEGDSNRFAHYLRAPDGVVTKISDFADNLIELAFGPAGQLYGVSWAKDSRGEIVVLPAGAPTVVQAKTLVPADRQAALGHSFYNPNSPTLVVTRDRLFAVYQTGGPSELRAFTLDGQPSAAPAQSPVSTVVGLTRVGDGVLFRTSSYVEPAHWLAFDPASRATRPAPLGAPAASDASDLNVIRDFARSKDGTQIPVNIIVPKGARLDGMGAIIVTGYGGFGLGRPPTPDRLRRMFFNNGVIWAEANLRGGNEFGDAWHRAGMLTDKQKVFDDFAAVITHLTAQKYAARDRVAIIGGSNGGLLVGALATEHPELASVVVARSGIFDSIRNELDTNGAFNVVELGSVKDAAQFRAIRAYSPYHNVRPGVAYPATLMLTSANDPRVNPMHSRKFAASLQAASSRSATSPILLLQQEEGGHGVSGSAAQIFAQTVDEYTFLLHYLRVTPKAE